MVSAAAAEWACCRRLSLLPASDTDTPPEAVLRVFFALWSSWPFRPVADRPSGPGPVSLVTRDGSSGATAHHAMPRVLAHAMLQAPGDRLLACSHRASQACVPVRPAAPLRIEIPDVAAAALETEAWRPGISGGLMPVLTPVFPQINTCMFAGPAVFAVVRRRLPRNLLLSPRSYGAWLIVQRL